MPQNSRSPAPPRAESHTGIGKPIKALLVITGLLAIIGGAVGIAVQSGLIAFPSAKEPVTVGIVQYVASLDQVVEGFKVGMQELGYMEGVNVTYLYQNSNGDVTKAKQAAADYIAQNVDVIFTLSTSATKAAYEATKEAGGQIPIVYGQSNVSIKAGIIAGYESSGNNVTGVENLNAEYIEQQLNFLKQIKPDAKKVGVFALVPPFRQPVTADALTTVDELAPRFSLEVTHYDVNLPPGPQSKSLIQGMVDAIKPGDVDALIQISDPATNFQDTPSIFIKAQSRLNAPVIAIVVPHVEQGALLSYGSNFKEQGRQAAVLVDKVLQGTKPADIPIEFSKHSVIAVNLKTARDLGLTIPNSILSIANIKLDK